MKRAVIFGGSGFIGRHLYASLKRAGAEVTIFDIRRPAFDHSAEEYVLADVRKPIAALARTEGAVVYNLAAVHRTPGHDPHEYYETNVLGALNVTQFATRAGGTELLFTSSISVYGPCEEEKTESSEPKPTSDYGRSKLIAEEIHKAWRASTSSGKLVIVRPAVVFGPYENGNFTRLHRMLKRRAFAYPGRRDTIKACGYVGELIRTMEYALGLRQDSVLYNFAYARKYTIEDICDAFVETLGTPGPVGAIPYPLLRSVAYLGLAVKKLGVETPIHPARIDKLYRSTNIAPAYLVASGYGYATDLRAALRQWSDETNGRLD